MDTKSTKGKNLREAIQELPDSKPKFVGFEIPHSLEMEVRYEGRVHCLCPITKLGDTLWFKVKMRSNEQGLQMEDVSFRRWLDSLAGEELGIEGMCRAIYDAIMDIIKPTTLTVTVETGYIIYNHKVKLTNLIQHLNKR